jgi:hypothetical protein
MSELELVPVRNPRMTAILTGVSCLLEKGGRVESLPPAFARTSAIADSAVSGFQPTGVSLKISSIAQTVNPLAPVRPSERHPGPQESGPLRRRVCGLGKMLLERRAGFVVGHRKGSTWSDFA